MQPTSPPEAASGPWRLVGLSAAAFALALAGASPALAAGPNSHRSPHPSASPSAQSAHHGTTQGDAEQQDATASPTTTASPATPSQSPSDSSTSQPGNNGHVFTHDTAGDNRPYDVPHVGCTFYLDFWGFDADQSLKLSFAGQAPTGKGTALDYSGGPVTIAHDAKAEGNYFDTEVPVTLDPTVLGSPHPKQGYHVKLTVATGQPGANGVKHKVFWMGPCASPSSPSPNPSSTATSGGGTQPGTTGATQGPGTTQVEGTTLHRSTNGDTPPNTKVLGTTLHRSANTSDSLPFTGAPLAGMVAAAVVALGGGVGLNVLGRRRRQRAAHR